MIQHCGYSHLKENSPLNRVKRTRVFRILLKTWLVIIPLMILHFLLSAFIYLNSFPYHIGAFTACILTGRNTSLNHRISWLFILVMDLFIFTQTQLDRGLKLIPAFAECHSKIPKNLSITRLVFYKTTISVHASLSVSVRFVIQDDSGSPAAESFRYTYQMPVPTIASVTGV